ncbi:MAG: phosphodiesterase, partial [Myxococcaceae bacterium]
MTHERELLIRPDMRAWAQESFQRAGRKLQRLEKRRKRKFLLVHLDGVPMGLIKRALAEGRMPFLKSLVESGAYNLDSAFWGSPASTPCFQAGVLYGIRHPNLPAYSWFERGMNKEVRMNAPLDTVAIESRLKAMGPSPLLEGGGTTYLSLF